MIEQLQSAFELPLFVGSHYLVLLLSLATAWALGRRITQRLAYRSELEAGVVSTALGLGIWGSVLTLAAMVGLFSPVLIVLGAVAVHATCRRTWSRAWLATSDWFSQTRSVAWTLAAALIALLLAPLLTLALYPPTAPDATMFHLPLARSIEESGRLGFFTDLRYPVFPALQEVLYAATLIFSSDVSANLLHFAALLLVALLVYCWGTWLASPRAGLWAALLWLGTEAGIKASIEAYVDSALALFVATALFTLQRYARRDDRVWLLISAAMLGFAASTKYHGLYFLVLVAIGVGVYTLRRRRWRDFTLFALVLGATSLPQYGFIFYHTGNPIFPFFPAIFGFTPWAYELRFSGEIPTTQIEVGASALLAKVRMLFEVLFNKARMLFDRDLVQTLRLPIDVFGGERGFAGAKLSPIFLLGLPLIAVLLFRFKHFRYLASIVGLYLIAWAATAKDLRYLLPVLPVVALLAAEGLDRLLTRLTPRRWPALAALSTLVVALLLALNVNQIASVIAWRAGRPPTTEALRQRYLSLRLQPFDAVQWLNETHGESYTLYPLFCESMKYYVEGRHLGDWFGPERYGLVLGQLMNRDALYQALRGMGVDYFLLPNLEHWKRRLAGQFPLPSAERLEGRFERVREDRFTELYRLLPEQEIEPGREADPRAGG